MTNLDDISLIKKALKGDRYAFSVLIERHYETIFRMAFKWCGVRSDAEDIAQDTCIKLARSLSQFKGHSAFSSWLYPVVINTARDYYRKKKRHDHPEAGIDKAEAAAGSAYDKLYAQQVMVLIQSLPTKERDALVLVTFEGLSHAEAAKKLKCAESTVSWRIHEARKKLEHELGHAHG